LPGQTLQLFAENVPFFSKPKPNKPERRLNMTKAIIDFSGYTGPQLIPAAQQVHDSMTTAAATFPAPPVTMAALQTLIDAVDAALTKKASGARADTIAFDIARNDLEGALGELGYYVNIIAKGDAALVVASGFPSYLTWPRTPDTAPPGAPANVVLRQGDLSGSFVARYKPDRQHSINEVQTNISDPNVDANWKHAGMFSGGKATLSGFPPGTTVWARIRTAGLRGVMGAWSDPAKIMVT
jgi:hypothetical protein